MVVRFWRPMRVDVFDVLAVLARSMCSAIVALDETVSVPPESTPDALKKVHPDLPFQPTSPRAHALVKARPVALFELRPGTWCSTGPS